MEVAEVGVETTITLNDNTVTTKNGNAVVVGDCLESGDAETTTVRIVTKSVAAAEPESAASDEESEEIIEVMEGDEDGETVEVSETIQEVKQQEVAPKSTTTTTVVRKSSLIADVVPETQSSSNTQTTSMTTTTACPAKQDQANELTALTTKVTKTIITTTPPTPTSEEKKVVGVVAVASEAKQPQQLQQQTQEEVVAEEEEQKGEEENKEEFEEEEYFEDDGIADVVDTVTVTKTNASTSSKPQQVTAEPAASTITPAVAQQYRQKQDTLNNTLKEIISDIDRDIEQQEDVAKLKAQQQELLRQQQVVAQQIRQQQLLARQLATQNQMQEQQLQQQKQQPPQQPRQQGAPVGRDQGQVSKSTTFEESQNENGYTRKNESYEVEEKDGLRTTRLTKSTVLESHSSGGMPAATPVPEVAAKQTFYDRYSTPTAAGASTAYQMQRSNINTSSSNVEESPNISKRIDLQKIFTPATDAEEILPKNRKLYASSAFYSSTLHPTVEDQVELARRISHSLSDISNQQSKGQSMYVNRKKRSVKWVHEGSGKAKVDSTSHDNEFVEESKENTDFNNEGSGTTVAPIATGQAPLTKVPLKLVMNPRGQIRDFNSVRESLNTATGLMSPDKCAELVTALNTQKGKGAELFAKRRRKAEKWVVDETNAGTQSPSGLPDYHQYQPKPPTSPSILPAYSDAGKHRVQLNMHQEQLLEKYAKPGLKVVKTPWEAALETGSASAAFVEEHKLLPYSNQPTPTISPAPAPQYIDNRGPSPSPYMGTSVTDAGYDYMPQSQQQQHKMAQTQYQPTKPSTYNSQRHLAYKPNIAQGWKAPSMTLPMELYVPKEIPLKSYAPPPVAIGHNWSPSQAYMSTSNSAQAPSSQTQQQQQQYPSYTSYTSNQSPQSSFPLTMPSVGGFCASGPGLSYGPHKQPHLAPTSYQTVPQVTCQAPQVSFNPSPLPYDKLAKFENPSPPERSSPGNMHIPYRPLVVPGAVSKVRNVSPAPFGARHSSVAAQSYPPMLSPQAAYGNGGALSPSYSTPGSSRPPSQQFSSYGAPSYENGSSASSRLSTADLSQCQNFNNAARGWEAGKSGIRGALASECRNTRPVAVAGNLPYTDF